MPAQFAISDAVRSVLAHATIEGLCVTLPAQLDRTLYNQVNKVLVGAGGKWDRRAQAHVFPVDPTRLLQLAVEHGEAVNRKTLYQSFYTPAALAERMAQLAQIQDGDTVLEPSAGHGALATAAMRYTHQHNIMCYDLDPEAITVLATRGLYAEQRDFLTVHPPDTCLYDAVLLNPPFAKGQDMRHVLHALKFLRRGGWLIAIVSATAGDHDANLDRLFQAALHQNGAEVETLPDDTFHAAGAHVRTSLLTLSKGV